ncbi:methionine aminopeptidase, type I [Aedoeadaptatus coxii]|uniref:Methionine aminopeptidase n=1 Tax=Aedoeadaptatus coxii TaxID=755172 RepID=A0A134AHE3_9FIRM|nr:type I methionyl aminopeptidase [Peptoniphilus coxii]KXB67085.1 methionine aminopeptidase, type I [Peptoniphilus coxii]CAC9928740.1 methionine aminopeptidase, type I [Peptoniphilus coxii]
MIIIKTKQEIEKMQIAADLLVKVHRALRDEVKPGVTTLELDRFVEKFITDRGGYPEQKGYQGFPYSICASVNDEICHGFPSNRKLKDGDLLTIDMVVNVDGYLADSAWSYAVGNISDEAKKLMDVTKECLYRSIALVKPGVRLGDIGHAIQTYAEANGFSVVRDFVGHGIGTNMHEDPQVLHYGKPGRGIRLEEGMVFTIEPMINAGDWPIKMDDNGWTARTRDGSLSCQYEHTLAVTADGVIVLTEQGE